MIRQYLIFFFRFKKINLNINNISNKINKTYYAENLLSFGNTKISTKYEIKDDQAKFISEGFDIKNGELISSGYVNLDPFNFNFDISSDNFNFKYLLKKNLFLAFLKTNLLFNKNFNGEISFSSKKVTNNKLFDNSIIKVKLLEKVL